VSVTVILGNQPPVAVDDLISTEQDDSIRFRPMDNDSDPDGDSISLVSVSQPSSGTAVVNGNSGWVIYTPDAGFTGTDSYTYTIEDSNGVAATGTVTIDVTAP